MSSNVNLIDKKGFLVILSAPSGAGKTTIYKELLKRNPKLGYSISTTTRPIRHNETNDSDYSFVDEGHFKELISKEEFAEWAIVHGNYYGTRKKVIDDALSSSKVLLFDIDVQGAMQLKELYGDTAVLVFIITPSYKALENRLRARSTDDEEVIEFRLKNALLEFGHIKKYDFVVVNDIFETAVLDLEMIIHAESLRLNRINSINWKGTE